MESYIHLYKTNDKFTEAYNGPDYKEPWLSLTEENMEVNYNKPKLTAITFDNITWVTDVPATGGTATKDNCTFKVYGNYDNGTSVDISTIVTVEGELVVEPSTEGQRHEAGQLTLTAKYSGFTATGNVTAYQAAVDFSAEPLTFNILSPGTISWVASNTASKKTIDYNLNDGDWTSITSNTEGIKITVNHGDKIQFRGDNTAYCGDNPDLCSTFSGSTAEFEVEGNIMSLINSTNFTTATTLESNFTFGGLFGDCTGLTSAENLILPATTLAIGCYFTMFDGCTSLTTAPKLPATTLAMGRYVSMFQGCTKLTTAPALPVTSLAMLCYQYMFQGCSSLTSAPELPATALTEACYVSMFNGCTKLTTAPALPATTLATSCYQSMFQNCTSLTKAPALPATILTQGCYSSMFNGCTSLTTAPELPATTLAMNCYSSMFDGCTRLTTAPKLPATILDPDCYSGMFNGCTRLTTAPELPATTLPENCYASMFNGCTSLNYIKCLATDVSAKNCTYNWVNGVASRGTFVKAPSMTSWPTGKSGIPTGWTAQDA